MAKVIVLSGDVGWEITANKIRTELAAAKGKDVEFHVNSPGGFVSEGIEIFNVIRAYKGGTVGIITGVAASMGSYIVLACDKVMAYDNAIYMIHNPWTLAIGDYNDMGKAFDMLKGMANLLAKEYAKKTGNLIGKMQTFMDDETFFFGDEMKSEGFVDEIIDAPEDSANDDDKASSLIVAKASISNCLDRMRGTEAANADIEKAVAYMDGMSALMDPPTKPKIEPAAASGDNIDDPAVVGGYASGTNIPMNDPAGAGNKNQEDKHMTLEALLADPANASARAEFELALTKARTEGETAAKDEMKAVIAKVSPRITSEAYGPDVKEAGIKAITGEGHISTFDTLVVIADRDIEAAKAAAAAGETEEIEETPGGGGDGKDAEAKAKFDEKFARSGKGV